MKTTQTKLNDLLHQQKKLAHKDRWKTSDFDYNNRLNLEINAIRTSQSLDCLENAKDCLYFDEWKGTDEVQNAITFLDCVAEEFIQVGKGIKGLDKD